MFVCTILSLIRDKQIVLIRLFRYDGASVNSRKKNLNLFSPPFFLPKQQKKKIKFIFSNVFPKTVEKINLNLFFLLFLEKRWRK